MAHNQMAYKRLGRLISGASELPFEELKAEYVQDFMHALKTPATRRNHTNVLQHIFGYIKKSLSAEAKLDIVTVIEQYRTSEVNLITPLTIIKHYLKQFGSEYINEQIYLEPYPTELGLQNNI